MFKIGDVVCLKTDKPYKPWHGIVISSVTPGVIRIKWHSNNKFSCDRPEYIQNLVLIKPEKTNYAKLVELQNSYENNSKSES